MIKSSTQALAFPLYFNYSIRWTLSARESLPTRFFFVCITLSRHSQLLVQLNLYFFTCPLMSGKLRTLHVHNDVPMTSFT